LGAASVPAAVGITIGTLLALTFSTFVQMLLGESDDPSRVVGVLQGAEERATAYGSTDHSQPPDVDG
jgi:hypothetical protein